MLEELDMTPDEFQKGLEEFIKNNPPAQFKTGMQLLDRILENGIPKGNVTVIAGRSDTGMYYHRYLEHLIKQKNMTYVKVNKPRSVGFSTDINNNNKT
jgi:predicted ATP-dependent serine protease